MGIYKRKQESKKTRQQELDQENKNSTEKKRKNFLFSCHFLVELLFSYFFVFFYKFPPREDGKGDTLKKEANEEDGGGEGLDLKAYTGMCKRGVFSPFLVIPAGYNNSRTIFEAPQLKKGKSRAPHLKLIPGSAPGQGGGGDGRKGRMF